VNCKNYEAPHYAVFYSPMTRLSAPYSQRASTYFILSM